MKKILQVATTGALMATMGVAMASDSMNGIQLSEKGLTLSINGTASLTVPNDEAQMNRLWLRPPPFRKQRLRPSKR